MRKDKNNVSAEEFGRSDGEYNSVCKNKGFPDIEKFTSFKRVLNNFKLVNGEEIQNFISHNPQLIDMIKTTEKIVKKHFPDYEYALEFVRDPEIPDFKQIIFYIKRDENTFDEDWEEVKMLNREIRKLTHIDNSLINVDLW